MKSTRLITWLANQHVPKALFTCVVYTNIGWCHTIQCFEVYFIPNCQPVYKLLQIIIGWHGLMWTYYTSYTPPLCWSGTLLVFELILADHFACVLSESLWIEAPSYPFPSEVSSLFGNCGSQVSIFRLIWFQCDGASWQLATWVVPAHGVAMDTFLPWPEVLRPLANL